MLSSSHARAPADDIRLTENARKVLEARYLKKNEAGECIETPADLFRRVARCVADVELRYGACESDRQLWENRYYRLMTTGAFMPNSPTLMNAGREMGMLSACFVLPVRDSINDIFDSIKHTALIQKAGGGTGFAFDELRPTGDYIASSGGTTSGPISFWRAFSEATNAIQQGAFRRGANMGMMYVHHPDILKFLHAKQDLNQFTNYNISVKMTDAWMDEFLADPDSPHVCRNPRTGQAYLLPRELDIWKYDVRSLIEIDCVEPVEKGSRETYYDTPLLVGDIPEELRGKVYTKRDIWNIIIQNAWQTGEPGVVFMDRINENNPTPHVGRIEATNPCGEQPLLPYEACNLGSINLGLFILDACTPEARVDWDGLRDAIHLSTRYLDNVIDANNYPLPEIDAVCKANRKIGLGVMGFADALYRLNVAYNSDEGVRWGERFGQFVNDEAHNCCEQLARERGCFANWKGSIWDTRHHRPMRNACCTTVAPTGTISIIANCSGGIEPMFSLAFIRNVLRGQKQGEKPLIEVNETFREVARRRGILSDELLERLATEGTLAHIDEVPEDLKRVFVCAQDITPEWHMQMQAAFQRHNDSSISKTINFPHSATPAQVEVIYRLAYELRCKGVTVYRDGCRSHQPMALKKSDEATKRQSDGVNGTEPRGQGEDGTQAGTARATNEEQPTGEDVTSAVAPAEPGQGRMREFLQTIAPDAARAASEPAATRASFPSASPFAASCLRPSVPVPIIEPIDLPEILSSFRMRQMTPFGNMHIHVTVDPRSGRELEVFAQLGKGGDVANSDLEAICRMISLWLRSGGGLNLVVKQLAGIGSSLQIPTKAGRIMSLGDGLACALKRFTRAKEQFGLRGLLLGEVDLSELDRPAEYTAGGPQAETRVRSETPAPARGPSSPSPAFPREAPSGASSKPNNAPAVSNRAADTGPGQEPLPTSPPSQLPTPRGGNGRREGNGSHAAPVARGASATEACASAVAALPRAAAEPRVAGSWCHSDLVRLARADIAEPAAGLRLEAQYLAPEATAAADLEITLGRDAVIEANAAADADAGDAAVSVLAAADPEVETAVAVLAPDTPAGDVLPTSVPSRLRARAAKHTHDVAAGYKLACPECGGTLALQEGCRKCHACGWAAC